MELTMKTDRKSCRLWAAEDEEERNGGGGGGKDFPWRRRVK